MRYWPLTGHRVNRKRPPRHIDAAFFRPCTNPLIVCAADVSMAGSAKELFLQFKAPFSSFRRRRTLFYTAPVKNRYYKTYFAASSAYSLVTKSA